MAYACSVFSLAMTVRLLISYLEFIVRSRRACRKSSATPSDTSEFMRGYASRKVKTACVL
jgi:hypothetical protein